MRIGHGVARAGWGPAVARARGLASRQLPSDTLAPLRRRASMDEVRRAVVARGFPLAIPADAPGVEDALRAGIARDLRALDRWLEPWQRAVLAPLFVDEDRRSVRRILRGLVAGASPAVRAAGALPTPTLPAAALADLAARPTVAAAIALLALWGHPFARALREEGSRDEPRLVRLELALDAAVGEVFVAALRRGGRPLRDLYRRWVDGRNACAAVVLAAGERELAAAECFLPGGRAIARSDFLEAATQPDARRAARRIGASLEGRLGRALRQGTVDAGVLESALLSDLLEGQRRLARELPLSAAPVASYVLAQREEAVALRRAAWSATLRGAASRGPAEAA